MQNRTQPIMFVVWFMLYPCRLAYYRRYTQEQIDDYKKKKLQENSPAPAAAAATTPSNDMNEWAHAFNKDGELQMVRLEETRSLFESRAVDGQCNCHH